MNKNIKIVVMGVLMAVAMCGCADKVYGTGKVIYTGARTAYIELPIPENQTLENIDTVLVEYDKVRTGVKQVLSEKKNEGANTSQ